MNELQTINTAVVTKNETMPTDKVVAELQKHGRVHLYQYDDGDWAAILTFFLPFGDSKLEVKAGGHQDRQLTLNSAVNALHVKVLNTKHRLSQA